MMVNSSDSFDNDASWEQEGILDCGLTIFQLLDLAENLVVFCDSAILLATVNGLVAAISEDLKEDYTYDLNSANLLARITTQMATHYQLNKGRRTSTTGHA